MQSVWIHLACLTVVFCTTVLSAAERVDRFDRLHEALQTLELTAEQKQTLDDLFQRTRQQTAVAQKVITEDRQAGQRQLQKIAAETRDEIARILTTEQQQALREQMQRSQESPPPPPVRPPPEPTTPRPQPDPSSKPDEAARFNEPGTPLDPGTPAPPIHLAAADGSEITLQTLPRKPIVLIFGSYSCPAFRHQVAMLNDLADAHRRRADFLIVYTREAHALGEWEVQRNRDDGIAVEQPKDLAARKSLAATAQRTLKIRIPIALDTMEDDTVRDYDAFPNGAVVLSKDRQVIGALRWTEPFALDALIREAATR